MKVVILAGGLGSRLSEETSLRPKPLVEIGGRPIIWHIMKHYAKYGFKEFVICLGYKAHSFKEYFTNFFIHNSDLTIDLSNNKIETHNTCGEDWKVTLVDTGLHTMTGGRVKQIERFITEDSFMLTYGDGVSDVNLHALLDTHNSHKKIGTLTAVQPLESRFGVLDLDKNQKIIRFTEKPKETETWINGGFFIFRKEFFKYLKHEANLVLEREPFEAIAKDGEFYSHRHQGFWKCMDTLRDKQQLEKMWEEGNAPWKTWG